MNSIHNFFLRAKHWQLFFIFVGTFLVAQVAPTASILTWPRSPKGIDPVSLLTGGLFAISMFLLLAWFWSIGVFFNSIARPELRLRTSFFRFALIYPGLYIPVFAVYFASPSLGAVAIILPLHFLAMGCMFYSLYFVSKSMALAETGRQVSFYDYAAPFLLLWFFPVGIWIVQPRTNRLFAASKSL